MLHSGFFKVDDDSIDDEELQGLLCGLIIRIEGFLEHEETRIKEVIENNGGRVYNDKMATNIADFMILPINYECD